MASRIVRGHAGGRPTLPFCSARQEEARGCTHSRQRNLSTVTVAPISSTIRGVPSEVVLDEEDGMKASCVERSLRGVTLLLRLRL